MSWRGIERDKAGNMNGLQMITSFHAKITFELNLKEVSENFDLGVK